MELTFEMISKISMFLTCTGPCSWQFQQIERILQWITVRDFLQDLAATLVTQYLDFLLDFLLGLYTVSLSCSHGWSPQVSPPLGKWNHSHLPVQDSHHRRPCHRDLRSNGLTSATQISCKNHCNSVNELPPSQNVITDSVCLVLHCHEFNELWERKFRRCVGCHCLVKTSLEVSRILVPPAAPPLPAVGSHRTGSGMAPQGQHGSNVLKSWTNWNWLQ